MSSYGNPFEAIMQQMNQTKNAYEQTMSGLQNQMNAIRNQASQFSPYGMQQYQQQQIPFQQQQMPQQQMPQQEQNAQVQNEIPAFQQELNLLTEIRDNLAKNNDLLQKMMKSYQNTDNVKGNKQSKIVYDESDKT